MKKIPISILCGLAALLTTIILYFTILGNIFARLICLVTLIGVLVAEAIVTLLAYCSKGEPRKVTATIVSAFMVPIAIALSFIYIAKFPNGYGSYLGYYFSANMIVLTIAAVIWKFTTSKSNENDALQVAKENMLHLRKLVKCILLKSGADKFKKELNDIEEKLHFSNDSVITESDETIRKMLIELENNISDENFNVAESIKAISNEIDRRNIWAKKTV